MWTTTRIGKLVSPRARKRRLSRKKRAFPVSLDNRIVDRGVTAAAGDQLRAFDGSEDRTRSPRDGVIPSRLAE
jgi:hypothetical protein